MAADKYHYDLPEHWKSIQKMNDWSFEHWNDGKVYLHNDNWEAFRKQVEKNGLVHGLKGNYHLPHDWNHTRVFCCLHTPRENIADLPAPGDPDYKYKIEGIEEWTMIFEPFPAFRRTEEDPEASLPSWHLWGEDKHDGEKLAIMYTGNIYKPPLIISFKQPERNYFAAFRDMFWKIDGFVNYGLGPNQPKKKVKVKTTRSITDPFEQSW